MNDYKAKIEAAMRKSFDRMFIHPDTNLYADATASLLQLITEARIEELNMIDYGYHNMLESPDGIRELFHHIQSRLAELKEGNRSK